MDRVGMGLQPEWRRDAFRLLVALHREEGGKHLARPLVKSNYYLPPHWGTIRENISLNHTLFHFLLSRLLLGKGALFSGRHLLVSLIAEKLVSCTFVLEEWGMVSVSLVGVGELCMMCIMKVENV